MCGAWRIGAGAKERRLVGAWFEAGEKAQVWQCERGCHTSWEGGTSGLGIEAPAVCVKLGPGVLKPGKVMAGQRGVGRACL